MSKNLTDYDDVNTFAPKAVFGIVILVLLGLAAFSATHVVPPGHRGISVTLGKVDPQARGEGLAFKFPMIEVIYNYPIKQITQESRAQVYSSDLQTVQISYNVLYRLPESKVVELFQQYEGNPYTKLLEPRVQEAIKEVAALFRAEDLVKNRQVIKKQIMDKTIQDLGDLIFIADIPITNIDLTDELERAIEQKTIREQEALAKEFELDKARKDAEIAVVAAEAEAKSVQIKGDALKSAPEVIELEIVKKWNGIPPTTVVSGKGGANILLPLSR